MNGLVLITRDIPSTGLDMLQQAGLAVVIGEHDRPLSPAELMEKARPCQGLLSMVTDRIDAALLNACPSLKAVSNYGVGTNNIDIAECTRRGIGVANTPGVLTDATAELAWTLLMAAARRVTEGQDLVRSGRWDGWGPMQCVGVSVCGKTLGIIGAGRIGQRVAQMARGFDMRILYTGRLAKPDFEQATGAKYVAIEQLLAESDFISLHCPLAPQTTHLIGRRQLELMKPTAVLINTARGPVVNEQDLLEALRSRRIFAAGLDVYEREPAITPGLSELPNVVCLPHVGSGTIETRQKMAQMSAENLIAMLADRRPAHPVNPAVWG